MTKKVTLETVAKVAGVSRGAVSQILGSPEHPRFPEATRKRVREAARRLQYRPNHAARTLRSGKSRLIGLVTPWNVPELIDTIELATNKRDYRTMLQFTVRRDQRAEEKALHAAIDRGVDGIIWLPADPGKADSNVLERIRDLGIRVVFLERALLDCPFDYDLVKVNMTGPLLEHFKQMQSLPSYEVIAAVQHRFHHTWGDDGRRFKRALRTCGAPSRIITVSSGQTPAENARELLDQLVPGWRTIVVSLCEWTAVRILQEARRRRLRIPEDFALVSFGDFLIGSEFRSGELTSPPLTAVRRPYDQIGRSAVELMLRRLEASEGNGTGKEATAGATRVIDGIWVERGSTPPVDGADS